VSVGDLALPARLRRAAQLLEYLAIAVPIGVLCTAILAGLLLGAALSVIWVGLPLLIACVGLAHRVAEVDRRQLNRLLDTHLAPYPRRAPQLGRGLRGGIDLLTDRDERRLVILVALKLPSTLLLLATALLPVFATIWLIAFGIQGIAGFGEEQFVGPWTLNSLTGLGLLVLGAAAAVVALAVLDGLHSVCHRLARTLLSPREQTEGPVREMLAESLGDRTLSVAYWLPDREIFVDESGRTVQMPEPESGRAWTAVERDGRRVAAIIHDAELDTGPELVNAAAAGAALAIDNERLKANLRARVEELRVSRVRIVEAADHARRRIERDLHDGAQQQLVSLSLDLRLLRSKLNGADAVKTVDQISEKLNVALAELRELARGIHPVILTERGLIPAIAALAQRAPVPVEADIAIHERLSPAIEAAAYFVVAEALTNVAKYAQAEFVMIDLRRERDEVTVVVEDDGVGGADVETGTGLRGLVDRLSALDGTLSVHSPRGGGTRLRARIPCASGDLVADMSDRDDPEEARL
jgi:signal transduction histidine kinase